MAVKLGSSSVSKLYLGSTEVTKAYLGSSEVYSSGDTTSFITTWSTTTANETITIPTFSGETYNYDISTSDGQTITGLTGDQTITFASAGDYDVSISGTFPRIYFNDTGDKAKIIDIKQWGNIAWTNLFNSFRGCNNLVGTYTDAPNISSVIQMNNAFKDCISFTGKTSNWNTSNITNLTSMFFGCSSFNSDLSSWNVINVGNINNLFRNSNFNQNLSSWNIIGIHSMTSFMNGANLSDNNYNLTLIGWVNTLDAYVAAGNTYTLTPSPHFGNAVASGAGLVAKNVLINTYSWVITDGSP